MSDPTTNREIEDVLSSIRRLVSQDRTPEKRAAPPMSLSPASQKPAVSDALVLTPALRVIDGDSGRDSGSRDGEPGGGDPEEGIGLDSGRIRGDTVLAALGAVGPIARMTAADDALEESRAWSDRERAADTDDATEATPDDDDTAMPEVDENWRRPSAMVDADAGITLEATIAELEAAVAGIDTEFEPDGGEGTITTDETVADVAKTGLATMASADVLTWADTAAAPGNIAPSPDADPRSQPADEAGTAAGPDAPGADRTDGLPAADIGAGSVLSLVPGLRRLHFVPGADRREPDAPADSADTGRAGIADPHPAEEPAELPRSRIFVRRAEVDLAATDPAEADLVVVDPAAGGAAPAAAGIAAEPETGAGAAPVRTSSEPDPETLAGLDLELLQRLVADTLRQELRGPLGERITQNVRKLVRREVMRALESREFE